MRVLIFTEGGEGIGFGHIARCISLSEVFKEKGASVELVINGDDSIKAMLKSIKHRIFDWLKNTDEALRLVTKDDIVIVDSYLADARFYKDISILAKYAIYIDDIKRLKYPKGIVTNGGIFAAGLHYPAQAGTRYLIGTKYLLLRKAFWSVPRENIRKEAKTVMITLGGADQTGLTCKILKFLNASHPALLKIVIIGSGFKQIKKIEGLKYKNTKLVYSPDAKNMKALMMASDIAISGGGYTLYEFALIGVPAIGICLAENQKKNLRGLYKEKIIEYIGEHDSVHLVDRLSKSLDRIFPYKIRCRYSRLSRKIVDGKGAQRVAAAIGGI